MPPSETVAEQSHESNEGGRRTPQNAPHSHDVLPENSQFNDQEEGSPPDGDYDDVAWHEEDSTTVSKVHFRAASNEEAQAIASGIDRIADHIMDECPARHHQSDMIALSDFRRIVCDRYNVS